MPESVDSTPNINIPDTTLTQPETKEHDGLKVNFSINNRQLISNTLRQTTNIAAPYIEDVVALQNFAWSLSKSAYNFVSGRAPGEFFALGGTLDEATNFMQQVEESDEFQKIRQQTEDYMAKIKSQWEQNYPQASDFVKKLTGLDLNKQVNIYVTHPGLNNGKYLGSDNITFGHNEDWNNYSTVYLWHEVLHSYLDNTALNHALIQFVTDNELRKKLNNESDSSPLIGHEELLLLMEKMTPRWQSYMAGIPEGGHGDIKALGEEFAKIDNIQQELDTISTSQPQH
ncbi:MAG TPA: hypothetical protein VG965_07255 [Patescibacteria group bacterium]|nr:hypothetical protein [Patescibacteria group bacterium]